MLLAMPWQAPPPPSLCLAPSPTSGVRCNGLPAQRDLAYDVILPAERQACEGPSQGPLPRPWGGGRRCQRLRGQALCFGVSRLPSDARVWVPSTHTPLCPRPARRRTDGGNPGASAPCTPPPRRGSGSARWLLSCKRGTGGLWATQAADTWGHTHTHTPRATQTRIQLHIHTHIDPRTQIEDTHEYTHKP